MRQVGPYRLLREVARGGMGVVYEALGPDGGRVALKVLLSVAKPDALGRFERERRLLAELSAAPGFVPLLDAGEAQGRPWLVMPFMEGGSLRERLDRGPLSVEAAVELGHQLGTAIGRAHARGIVHRDLKPENVLYERGDGSPRIADLGVAKHFRREGPEGAQSVSLSKSGAMLGTACYMAPEQLKDARSVGPPADVFALAQLVYEALAGVTPFRGETLNETLTLLIEGRPVPLRARVPAAPAWLEAVLTRALATEPGERWPDGRAFARALVLGERGVAAAREAQAARGRRVAAAGLAGALGLALLVGAVAVVSGGGAPDGAEDQRPAAGAPAPASTPASGAGPAAGTRPTPASLPSEPRATATPRERAPATRARLAARVHEAARAAEAGDVARCVAIADEVLAEDPSHDGARAVRAAFTQGLPRGELERLLEVEPAAWLFAARAAARLTSDVREALADVDRALALEPTPWRLVLRAEALVLLERAQEAVDAAEVALAQRPELARGWVLLSLARRQLRQVPQALEAGRRAVALAPGDADAQSALGMALLASGALVEARDALDVALALEPDNVRALAGRGSIHNAEGRLDDARRLLERVVAAGVTDPGILNNLALTYTDLGEWRLARDTATSLLAGQPDDVGGHAIRGLARQRLGDLPGARADLEHLLALDPAAGEHSPWVAIALRELADVTPGVDPGPDPALEPEVDRVRRVNLLHEHAVAALQGQDPARAVELCDQGLALDPDSAALLGLRGSCRPGTEGLPDLDRAIAVGPVQAYFHVNRADRRAMLGDLRGALDDMDQALIVEPATPFRLVRRADLRRRAGEVPGAIDDLRAALALDDDDRAAWKHLALCLRLEGAVDDALAAARRAVEVGPGDHEAWTELALAHVAGRAWTAAIEAAERALTLLPDQVGALRARGLAREGLGDRAGALADLERLVEPELEAPPPDVAEALARLRSP